MNLLDVLGIAQVAEAAPLALSSLARFHREKSEGVVTASPMGLQASLDLQAASVELLQHFNTARTLGVPPSIRGALWTWPTIWTVHKEIPRTWVRITVAIAQVQTFGTDEVFEAAMGLINAISDAAQAFPRSRGAQWQKEGLKYDEQALLAYEALWHLGRAIRMEAMGTDPPSIGNVE